MKLPNKNALFCHFDKKTQREGAFGSYMSRMPHIIDRRSRCVKRLRTALNMSKDIIFMPFGEVAHGR